MLFGAGLKTVLAYQLAAKNCSPSLVPTFGDGWRSLGESNPCFRRERATSWAARRREPQHAAYTFAMRKDQAKGANARGGSQKSVIVCQDDRRKAAAFEKIIGVEHEPAMGRAARD
jgi:hypothetical protein